VEREAAAEVAGGIGTGGRPVLIVLLNREPAKQQQARRLFKDAGPARSDCWRCVSINIAKSMADA